MSVAHTSDHCESTTFNYCEDSLMMASMECAKHVRGYCVHLLCVYASACKFGFMYWFLQNTRYTQQ